MSLIGCTFNTPSLPLLFRRISWDRRSVAHIARRSGRSYLYRGLSVFSPMIEPGLSSISSVSALHSSVMLQFPGLSHYLSLV